MKSRSIVIALILALLCAGLANAAVTVSSPTLGGESQERGQNVQTTITVQDSTNGGTEPVTVTLISNSGYNVMFDDNTTVRSINLSGTTAQTLTIKAYVPLNHDAVDSNLNLAALQIGTINAGSATSEIRMQAVDHLSLDKIKFTIGGKSKTLADGDEFTDARLGDDMTIDITVRNDFAGSSSDHTNVQIKDVKVRAKSEDMSGFDLNEDDTTTVDADSKETVTFDGLSIADDTSDGSYDVDVTASGRDKNGALHGQKAVVTVTVKRNSHEIAIRSASLSRSTVSCDNPTTDVSAFLVDIGTHDEDNVALRVENDALGINQYVSGMSLSQDDSTSRTVSIAPKTDKPGTYTLDIVSYWNGNTESNRQQVTLTVAACTPTVTPTPTTSTTSGTQGATVVVTPQPVVTPTPVVTPQPTTPQPVNVPVGKVSSSSKTDWSVPLLIVGIVIVLVLLGLLVAVLVRGGRSA